MKCPYCGVHYMDDERECPICGKRSPVFGEKSRGTAHNHTELPADTPTTTCSHMDDQERDRGAKRFRDTDKYPSIRHAETAAPAPATAPPAKKSGSAKSTSTQATRSASDWGADKQKKKGAGAIVAVIVVAVLLQILPALIEVGTNFMDDVRYSGESPVQVFEDMLGGTPEPDHAPEPAGAGMPEAFQAVNENTERGITLELDNANDAYMLFTPNREEAGTFYWWYNDEDYYYTEEFPQDAYDCYTLCFDVSSFSQTGGTGDDTLNFDSPYYLDAYFPAGDLNAQMTVLPSIDLPAWMEDDTPIVLTRQ